jgi:hypothetical protein
MYPCFTRDQFLALFESPSSADYEAVYVLLQHETKEQLSWEPPGDDAEYITELRIGDIKDPKKICVTFSRWGNLCYAHVPTEPILPPAVLEDILQRCGWNLVSPEASTIVLFPPRETVHDRFFNYI